MAGLQVHTAETAYAVTQAEIKAWNKIDSSDDDTVVELIERAVHNWAKEYTEIITPTHKSLFPVSIIPSAVAKSCTKYVKKGITIVNPIISMNTTRKRINIGERPLPCVGI